jgi:Raf kinase inhibitor-like YbhB/YbcL family protein
MKLTSRSFADGQPIPARFAFGRMDPQTHITLSDNISPHLAWSEVPEGTQSFVLLCHDPDVPSVPDDVNQTDRQIPHDLPRVDFFHWVLVDLAMSVRELPEGLFSQGVTPRGKAGPTAPMSARQGINDYTTWFANDHDMSGDYFGYDGPCPPFNDSRLHHYVFTLYALSIPRVAVDGRFGGADVLRAIEGRVLASARLTGTYTLNPALARGV